LSHDAVRRPAAKILTRDELLARHGRPRTDRLVFTNGVFDILHRGHIEYLDAARRMGDCLVVALNTDESVRRLDKGHARPVVPQADRAAVLAALESVDVVTLFDEDTPAGLIARLLPDVLVKGGDYSPDQVVGRADVEAAGGRVAIIPFLAGRSTTDLIRRIRTDTDR
jgi:D-beta-D-heptose 7-phosphate kinase/D-beta-D-heptose 1-phosphate adenosyltransferase